MNELIVIKHRELERKGYLPLDQNPAAVYLASLSASSRRPQAQALNTISMMIAGVSWQDLDWSRLRYQHTAAIRAQLVTTYAPKTANRILSALRMVLKQGWRLGQIHAEDYARAIDISPAIGQNLPAGRMLSREEITRLFVSTEAGTKADRRDAAILALGFGAGMRREEIVNLKLSDYDPTRACLEFVGKRTKERRVYMAGQAAAAVDDWIKARGHGAGPLILAVNKAGAIRKGEKLNSNAIYHILTRRALHAGVDPFTPHDMRRTFVSDLLAAGLDELLVARQSGHSDLKTLRLYDRRPDEALQQAMRAIDFPYKRKEEKK